MSARDVPRCRHGLRGLVCENEEPQKRSGLGRRRGRPQDVSARRRGPVEWEYARTSRWTWFSFAWLNLRTENDISSASRRRGARIGDNTLTPPTCERVPGAEVMYPANFSACHTRAHARKAMVA
jgi:hypothetical protein